MILGAGMELLGGDGPAEGRSGQWGWGLEPLALPAAVGALIPLLPSL